MLPTQLGTSVSDTDLFTYDDSPLEDERDPDNSRFPSNWVDLAKQNMGTIVLPATYNTVQVEQPPFVQPYYNYVNIGLNSGAVPAQDFFVYVCNQCQTVVPMQYQTQHTDYHRDLYRKMVELNAPRYVVSVDPATGSSDGLGGASFLRPDPAPSPGIAQPPSSNQRVNTSLEDVCDNCSHKRRDHSITVGSTKWGGCSTCGCNEFTLYPF